MTAQRKIDKAIVKVVGEAPEPISIKSMMHRMDKGNLHEGRSMRTVADRVYELRRQGVLVQVGVGASARYTMPVVAVPTTEAAHQIAEGQRREAATTASASDTPNGTTHTANGTPEVCDLIDLGPFYLIQPRTPAAEVVEQADEQKITPPQPTSVIVLDGREPERSHEQPFDARVAEIAKHIGTTVTLTVQQLISEALREKEATVKMQNAEIGKLIALNDTMVAQNAELIDQIARLKADMAEQEQLYNELDTRYNTLRSQLAGLAA